MESPALKDSELERLVDESFDMLRKIMHEDAAKRCGVVFLRGSEGTDGRYIVNVLNKTYTVELGRKAVLDLMSGRPAGGKLSYVLLTYLMAEWGRATSESWHPIQSLLRTQTLTSYFQKSVIRPLTRTFGYDKKLFESCAAALGGNREKMGGSSFSFTFLPKVRFVFQLWSGSYEDLTQPEASVSCNTLATKHLPLVSLIYACEVIVGFLEKESKAGLGRRRS